MSRREKPSAFHDKHLKGVKGPNGRLSCKGCGEEVPKGRRCWCSEACVEEWRASWLWPSIRLAAWVRDEGMCQACGLDVAFMHRIRHRLRELGLRDRSKPFGVVWGPLRLVLGLWGVPPHRADADLWDADHETAIEDGGSLRAANVRVLCIPCHAAKTSREATARAKRRRRVSADEAVRELGL